MANSFECPFMTDEDFNIFHTIDRELFALLINTLGFDTNLAMQIVALLLWMEKLTGNNMLIIKEILTLPLSTLEKIVHEAVICLTCAESENYFSQCVGNSVSIRFLPEHMNNPFLDLGFFHSNRDNVMKGVSEIVKNICERAFRDIVDDFVARGGSLAPRSEVAECSRMGERRNAVDESGMVMPHSFQPQHPMPLWNGEIDARGGSEAPGQGSGVAESSRMGEMRNAVDGSEMVMPLSFQSQHPMPLWNGEIDARGGSEAPGQGSGVAESSRMGERRNAVDGSGMVVPLSFQPQHPMPLWNGEIAARGGSEAPGQGSGVAESSRMGEMRNAVDGSEMVMPLSFQSQHPMPLWNGEIDARGGSEAPGQGSGVAESSRMGERRNAVDGSGMVVPLSFQPQHPMPLWNGEIAARGGSVAPGQGSGDAESSRMGERRNTLDGSRMVMPLLIQPQHPMRLWNGEIAARVGSGIAEFSRMGEMRNAVMPLSFQPQHPMHLWQGELAAGSSVVGESSRTAERRNEAGVFNGSMLGSGMPLLPQQPVMLWQGPFVWLPAPPTYEQVIAPLPLGYSVPAMGLGLPMHMYGMERFPVNNMEGQRQLVVNQQGNNGVAEEEQIVPPEDRTLLLTFARGYPVSEDEIRDFFTRRFGNFIENIFMQEVAQGEQVRYARIIATSASVIEGITQGCRVMYSINGKNVLARQYIKEVQNTSQQDIEPVD